MTTHSGASKGTSRAQRGMSLIEVSIGLIVLGLLMAGFLATYKIYQATRANTVTEENFMAVQEALGTYVALTNRYPRPMIYGAQDGQDTYGLEGPVNGHTSCTTAASATGRICENNPGAGGAVLVGLVPFAELNIPPEQARDGFGRLFTYAVSKALTAVDGNDPTGVDADDNPIFHRHVCVRSQDMNEDGSFVDSDCTAGDENPPTAIAVVSHGQDGIGAWLPSGRQFLPCAALSAGSQNENCDFDGIFMQSMRRDIDGGGAVTRTPALMRGNGIRKNDDLLQVEVREDTNFWAENNDDNIGNRYNYRVGIGVQDPQAPLDVGGNIKANVLLAEELCKEGSSCLKTSAIAGALPEMRCGELGRVRAIRNNTVECQYVAETGVTCPAGQYVAGFNATGTPICEDLPASCGSSHGQATAVKPTTNLCYNGTASAVAGTGPWTWRCTSGSQVANCETVPAGSAGCTDECGENKIHGQRWCKRNSPGNMECVNGAVIDHGYMSGIGCGADTPGTRLCN